jgi:hypothetical protein
MMMSDHLNAKDLVLAYGPQRTPWENGRLAARFALVIAMPLMLVKYSGFLRETFNWDLPFMLLQVLLTPTVTLAYFVASGFFFGFFFEQIRGRSGFEKGLFLAAMLTVCQLPVWISTFTSGTAFVATVMWTASQTFLFFLSLGVIAFDYRTLRQTLGERFDWRYLTSLGDVRGLISGISIALASLGISVTTVLSSQVASVVKTIVEKSFLELPPTPP